MKRYGLAVVGMVASIAVHAGHTMEHGACVHLWRPDVILVEHEAMLHQGHFTSWR